MKINAITTLARFSRRKLVKHGLLRPRKLGKRVTSPRKIFVGGDANHDSEIPRTIWCYWDGPPSPSAQACIASWHYFQPNYDIRTLNRLSVKTFLPGFPDIFDILPTQKVSNLVRLSLLERYGGIWMDQSILLTEPLDWIVSAAKRTNADLCAFFNEFRDEYLSNRNSPIIENGFLIAQAKSPFVALWRERYEKCITSEDYRTYYQSHPDWKTLTSNFINKDVDYLAYFVCYIAAQEVFMSAKTYSAIFLNAEDEYYRTYYSTSPARNKWQFAESLLYSNPDAHPPRIIKITGGHREVLDQYILDNCFDKQSILGRFLEN